MEYAFSVNLRDLVVNPDAVGWQTETTQYTVARPKGSAVDFKP
jgi:hypothetical protein